MRLLYQMIQPRTNRLAAFAVVGMGLASSNASAQPVSEVVEGAGVKVGDGTVLHPVLGIETGVVTNVFYEDGSEGRRVAGLLRIIAEIAAGSLPSERLQAPSEQDASTENYGDFAFRVELSAQYEEYLSSVDAVQAQRDIALAALARGLVFPKRTWQFAFSEEFRRENRPVNFESSDNVDRDLNRIGLELRFRPEGRTVTGALRYSNVIDYFEDESQHFANRISHTVGAQAGWQFFPVTRGYLDASFGFVGGLGSASTRPDSNPVQLKLGLATALTVKTSLHGRIGYSRAFYETGPDFSNITGSLQLGYRFSPQARFAAIYEYDFHDSINANFYRDHAAKVRFDTRRDRFAFGAGAEIRFRLYRGVIQEVMGGTSEDRSDVIFSTPLSAVYNFQNWIAATLDYRFTLDHTDFRYNAAPGDMPDNPSYQRHSLMAGVRAAY